MVELARLIGWYGADAGDDVVEARVRLSRGRWAWCAYTAGTMSLCHTSCARLVDHRGWVRVRLYGPDGAGCGTLTVEAPYLAVVNVLTWARWPAPDCGRVSPVGGMSDDNDMRSDDDPLQRIILLLESPGGSLFAGILMAAMIIGGVYLVVRSLL